MRTEMDIMIVGGGIQGLFTAYYAAKKFKGKKICLFESNLVGQGITAYSGHLHAPYGVGTKHDLTFKSIDAYEKLKLEFTDIPMETRDFQGIVSNSELDGVLENLVHADNVVCNVQRSANGYSLIQGLESNITKRSFPFYLLEKICELGVVVMEGTPITKIEKEGGSYEYIAKDHLENAYHTNVIISAIGPKQYDLEKRKDLRMKKVIAFHVDQKPEENEPVTYFFDDDAFLMPQPYYGRYLYSYPCQEWDIDLNENPVYEQKDREAAKNILIKYKPELSDKIMGAQVFYDVYNMPHNSPLIEEVSVNYYTIGATGGSGVRLAPALAIDALDKIEL